MGWRGRDVWGGEVVVYLVGRWGYMGWGGRGLWGGEVRVYGVER